MIKKNQANIFVICPSYLNMLNEYDKYKTGFIVCSILVNKKLSVIRFSLLSLWEKGLFTTVASFRNFPP